MAETASFKQPSDNQITPIKAIDSSSDNKEEEKRQSSEFQDKNSKIKKKRKRKVHKNRPQLDPEEIKEILKEKINIKREYLWNNRFVNETIPAILQSKSKKRFNFNTKKGKSSVQTYIDKPLKQYKEFQKTIYPVNDNLQKLTHKSFKIRHLKNVSDKNGQQKKPRSQNGGKTPLLQRPRDLQQQMQKDIIQIPKPVVKKKQKQIHKIINKQKEKDGQSQIAKTAKESKQHSMKQPLVAEISNKISVQQRLLTKLKQKLRIHPISNQYQEFITQLINKYNEKKSKELKHKLQKEIDQIGTQKHFYKVITNFIKGRREAIKELIEKGEESSLKLYINFQVYSLAVLQQILKSKSKWQQIYQKHCSIKKKIDFIFQGKNYLLNMKNEVKQLCGPILDPFLVKKTTKLHRLVDSALSNELLKQRKEMILKIRACQLLLIEQELQGN